MSAPTALDIKLARHAAKLLRADGFNASAGCIELLCDHVESTGEKTDQRSSVAAGCKASDRPAEVVESPATLSETDMRDLCRRYGVDYDQEASVMIYFRETKERWVLRMDDVWERCP
ncbi:hypothetical protein [Bradyrhizobium sp.]|uniref:hypothetical protein n=1 Tax=Bradyrhizobium sp. TaxID=376 RepID=UPI003C42CAD3